MTPLRSLLLLLLGVVAQARVEPSTKIGFADTQSGQPLVGVGVRKKGPIKVYGVGLYVDSMGSKMSLSKYKKYKEDQSALPKSFFEDLVCGGFGKTLVLKMAYGVTKEKIAGALGDSIKPRLPAGSSRQSVVEFEQLLLDGCEKYAKDGRAGAGTCFTFGVRGSNLGVEVNGKKVGVVHSKPLCQALLNCYFDATTVSQGLKDTCAQGILEML